MFWNDTIETDKAPHAVNIIRDELEDTKRKRIIPIKMTYPRDENLRDLPLVIWSHGLGGGREGAGFLSRFIAGYGYAVLHIQHPGTDTSLWEGKDGHPWDIMRNSHIPRKQTLARFCDVPFVLDQVSDWLVGQEALAGRVDLSNIGMSGHSFGAITTLVMAGMKLGRGRRLYDLKDNRISCAISYSAPPAYNRTDRRRTVYDGMDIPMLQMSGTLDDSPLRNFKAVARREPFENTTHKDHMFLTLEGGDHMVYVGSRGQLEDSPLRARHEEIIKVSALAFWDAFLKKDQKARDWLKGVGYTQYLNNDAAIETRS